MVQWYIESRHPKSGQIVRSGIRMSEQFVADRTIQDLRRNNWPVIKHVLHIVGEPYVEYDEVIS